MPAIAPPDPARKRLSRSGHRLPLSKERHDPRSLAAIDVGLSWRQDLRDRRGVASRFSSDVLFVLLTGCDWGTVARQLAPSTIDASSGWSPDAMQMPVRCP